MVWWWSSPPIIHSRFVFKRNIFVTIWSLWTLMLQTLISKQFRIHITHYMEERVIAKRFLFRHKRGNRKNFKRHKEKKDILSRGTLKKQIYFLALPNACASNQHLEQVAEKENKRNRSNEIILRTNTWSITDSIFSFQISASWMLNAAIWNKYSLQ